MKVLHVSNHFWPCIGGIEKVVEDISAILWQKGYGCEVVCLNRCPKSSEVLSQKDSFKGMQIARIPFLDLKYYKIAPSVLGKAKGFDVLHVHGIGFFSDFLILTKPLHGKPVVVSTYGGIFHTKKLGLLKWFYFYIWNRFLLNFADSIIAISKNDFELFRKISKKVVLCEIGALFEKFENIKVKTEKNTFLFVGRFAPNKQIENLIEVFEKVIKTSKSTKLFIIGKDQEGNKKKFEEMVLAKGLGKNVFIDSPATGNDFLEYFSKAEFFVSASEFESFGLSGVEAMSIGMIPILNDIESFRNFIVQGKNGFLLDYSNPDIAAKRILEIMEIKSKKNISEEAKKTALSYSWENKFAALEKIYLDAAKKIT